MFPGIRVGVAARMQGRHHALLGATSCDRTQPRVGFGQGRSPVGNTQIAATPGPVGP